MDVAKYLRVRDSDEEYKRNKLIEAVASYGAQLDERLMFDYANLEQEALSRLEAAQLATFLGRIRAVLVDEYQDTNLTGTDLLPTRQSMRWRAHCCR